MPVAVAELQLGSGHQFAEEGQLVAGGSDDLDVEVVLEVVGEMGDPLPELGERRRGDQEPRPEVDDPLMPAGDSMDDVLDLVALLGEGPGNRGLRHLGDVPVLVADRMRLLLDGLGGLSPFHDAEADGPLDGKRHLVGEGEPIAADVWELARKAGDGQGRAVELGAAEGLRNPEVGMVVLDQTVLEELAGLSAPADAGWLTQRHVERSPVGSPE